ncbi:phosphoribosylamine--glycine ligase [Coriobacterium glomerans PW2]|uniref:Phosphoribosylamine--glycine ligase n=1 Tax=Coriobacterium glomerans (strain ATCC 49209 / DSM 20642 / JCM 10262 / PW2) TaxID=700015 RepID=F2N9C2_CORGP|nr:phosphoribosylamine--glycine ligase [Coriobacterium glomerans]AEB07870.1 phosphoribosylamine--glycine ligase [Coriobacterium glomerans PW2]
MLEAKDDIDRSIDILLLGAGGREHAIASRLSASARAGALYIAPGNAGTAQVGENVELDESDPAAVCSFAREHGVGLVVIGPEAPLVAGVADAVRAAGIPCFGPGRDAARLEGSKSFSKRLMERASIPTARYAVFSEVNDALAYVREQGAPLVIKADGLAAGKGVTVAHELDQALDAVRACFSGSFGDAGSQVVIEEMLSGPECSLLAFTDGRVVRAMAPSQDHKRAWDGDRGPNTGGMGAVSPVPVVSDAERREMERILDAVMVALAEDGIEYRGCIYGGFMLTPSGPKVIEFNARFGDPETQVVLPRMEGDLLEIMLACARGGLDEVEIGWREDCALTVVLASAGYPGSYKTGKPISGIAAAEEIDGVTVFHAGTTRLGDRVVSSGGRVLAVTALGSTLSIARERAYAACEMIDFEGKVYRSDIGERALQGRSRRV